MEFDLSGRAGLTLVDVDDRVARYVRAQMDPYAPSPSSGDGPTVLLECEQRSAGRGFVDVQNPATDGVVTASDGSRLSIVYRGAACTIPDALQETPARFAYQPGFPIWRIFGFAVRPALQLAALARQAAAVHSTSVEVDGGGLMIAGWSESGKTETALAFAEEGAGFLSDKWTLLGSDGMLSTFPIGVGIRRWVLPYLPRLRSSLPGVSRAQMAAAAVMELISRPARNRGSGGRVAETTAGAVERATALADRASLTLGEVREAYGQADPPPARVPLRAIALITTVAGPEIEARPADPAWAVSRLARSAAFERRRYFALQERARYALGVRDDGRGAMEQALELERGLLEQALAGKALIEVRAPFPTDPRRVASAISAAL